jgi:hypothetical protein
MTTIFSWSISTDQEDKSEVADFNAFTIRLESLSAAPAIAQALKDSYERGKYDGALEAAARVSALVGILEP